MAYEAHDLSYADRVVRQVPGLHDMHRLARLLLAERVPAEGRVLVLGAGGGMELKAFADAQPGWRFDGVDPAPDMLDTARATVGDAIDRIAFHEGYIDDAPEGPFDGAACLLTLHFLPREERLRTVRDVHRRLKPGAPFVIAQHSFPNEGAAQDRWLARNAALLLDSGFSPDMAAKSVGMKHHLPVLSPEQDADLLREAGFTDVELFYAAFTFKGWVASA